MFVMSLCSMKIVPPDTGAFNRIPGGVGSWM